MNNETIVYNDNAAAKVSVLFYDRPRKFFFPRVPEGSASNAGRKDITGEVDFKRLWLVGMKMVKIERLPDGTFPERNVDVTQYLLRFYQNLGEREPNTPFFEKLATSYVTRYSADI